MDLDQDVDEKLKKISSSSHGDFWPKDMLRIGGDDMENSSETGSNRRPYAAVCPVESKEASLRQWLDNTKRVVDALECLHIFMQIVEIVNLAHSQGFVVHNGRPSCFVMSSFNRVSFIESVSCSDSSSNQFSESSSASLEASSVAQENKQPFPMKQILQMETNWYTSPEEASGAPSSYASDVYRLGVLLFELYCPCSSTEEKNATMSSLRHRVFPPQLHCKWPKEAFLSLRLLHPEPTCRPKLHEVLQSELLNEPRANLNEREDAIELKERIVEEELLLEFLLTMQQKKQEAADNLHRNISFLSSDLQEVTKLETSISEKGGSSFVFGESPSRLCSMNISWNNDSARSGPRKRVRTLTPARNVEGSDNCQEPIENQENVISRSSRLLKNLKKLESAYFLTRDKDIKPIGKPFPGSATRRINPFLEGLCKYMSFSRLKVKTDLKQADLLNSSNLVCSLSFDRDREFFATASVNKKIKVFEYDSILNENRDIHYPLVEIPTGSKLSSICWNGYIKSQIASSNFEGVVQVWDVTQNQAFLEMREHERRVWSVDFSSADPTLLASGSDDGSVKLWNINQGGSVSTIRAKANVCCVQFPSDSGNILAFGSADHRIYYYDIRFTSMPICTLVGHKKTVSYIKFIDSKTLVSSSTDNTLKLWDLSDSTLQVLDRPLQSFTGHTNVKNFVGLSVSDGYIMTGSETNEVFIYHKAFPMPALSYKFNTTDPISGDEVDDTEQFISSVCWRGQSSTLVAANSTGNIKILEMV